MINSTEQITQYIIFSKNDWQESEVKSGIISVRRESRHISNVYAFWKYNFKNYNKTQMAGHFMMIRYQIILYMQLTIINNIFFIF